MYVDNSRVSRAIFVAISMNAEMAWDIGPNTVRLILIVVREYGTVHELTKRRSFRDQSNRHEIVRVWRSAEDSF